MDWRRKVRPWIAGLYPSPDLQSPWDDRLAERLIGRHLSTDPYFRDPMLWMSDADQDGLPIA